MTRLKRLLLAPAVPDDTTLAALVFRLGHYLSNQAPDVISIPITGGLEKVDLRSMLASSGAPRGFEPESAAHVTAILPALRFLSTPEQVAAATADVLAFWDIAARDREPWRSRLGRFREGRTVFDIDWQHTPDDGAAFADLVDHWSKQSRRFNERDVALFRSRTEHLLESRHTYLIGTGPFARRALDLDLSDGVRIYCNTAILDDDLVAHAPPDIVTFADPHLHFGPTTYARDYQRLLARRAASFDFTVITAERYANLLRGRLPELAHRVVGVRLLRTGWPQNYDLMRQLAVRATSNILTTLMLPLAATFSESIALIGFDGRGPHDTTLWRYGATVQFERQLAEARLAHAAYFERDHADYANQHVAALEQVLLDIETRGGTVRPLSPSSMLPLRRRAPGAPPSGKPSGSFALTGDGSAAPIVVSITPDWTGDWGHFGPWERTVGTAAEAAGYRYRSLASIGLASRDPSARPTFTHGTLGRECVFTQQFERELRAGLNEAAGQGPEIACFYTADVWHLPVILEVACERPNTTFVVNLLRAHSALDAERRNRSRSSSIPAQLLTECIDVAAGTNVHVCLDSAAIIGDLEQVCGRSVPLWPMTMLGDPQRLWDAGRLVTPSPVRLVAPVHAQTQKGFHLIAALAERLTDRMRAGTLELIARFAPQPINVGRQAYRQAEAIRRAGGVLIEENLSDDEYATMVGAAHVAIVPYSLTAFRTRTSGVVLDAIAAGKPVIAVRGSWAGDLIERNDVGTTFDDESVDSLELAIERVIGDLTRYTSCAEAARQRLVAEHRPERLVAFLTDLAAAGRPPPDAERISRLRRIAALGSAGHFPAEIRRLDDLIDRAIQEDDLARIRDNAFDQADTLRLSNEFRQREIDRLQNVNPPPPPTLLAPTAAPSSPSEDNRPQANRTTRLPTDLGGNVYDRQAGAHLDELELIAALVQPERMPNGVMIDVGAHLGGAFQRFHRAGWQVHAFEPDQRNARRLAERYGRHARVEIDHRAVGNVTGERVAFFTSAESSGISGLSAFHHSHVPAGDVETVALRDVTSLVRADLLKVDTEGYEMRVLEGFPWERITPSVVVAEFDDAKTTRLGYVTADLVEFLRRHGYQVWISEWHPVVRYGIRHQWKQLVPSGDHVPEHRSWGNLLAFRRPIPATAISSALTGVLTFEPPSSTVA